MNSGNQLVQQSITALRQDDTHTARDLLSRAVTLDPHNEQAWIWLSGALSSQSERKYCLERVLTINPHNDLARRALETLPPVGATAPAVLNASSQRPPAAEATASAAAKVSPFAPVVLTAVVEPKRGRTRGRGPNKAPEPQPAKPAEQPEPPRQKAKKQREKQAPAAVQAPPPSPASAAAQPAPPAARSPLQRLRVVLSNPRLLIGLVGAGVVTVLVVVGVFVGLDRMAASDPEAAAVLTKTPVSLASDNGDGENGEPPATAPDETASPRDGDSDISEGTEEAEGEGETTAPVQTEEPEPSPTRNPLPTPLPTRAPETMTVTVQLPTPLAVPPGVGEGEGETSEVPPPTGTTPSGYIQNGGNIRSEPRVAANTAIGQVCPGDQVDILDRQGGWVYLRVTATAADCVAERVASGTEGWVSETLAAESSFRPDETDPAMPTGLAAAVVNRTTDGDTLQLTSGSASFSAAPVGLDAPEPGECFGSEAATAMRDLMGAGFVLLEPAPNLPEQDEDGQALFHVWLPDGRLASLELIRRGEGFFFSGYASPLDFRYQDILMEAENQASEEERGVWSPETCGGRPPEPTPAEDAGAAEEPAE